MFPGSVEITERLSTVASHDVLAYNAALRFHFALWKWQRISDAGSLSLLRRILAEHGLVEPNPNPAWIVNRGFAEYRQDLGDSFTQDLQSLPREALNGHALSDQPLRAFDSGSGNCTMCYESTRPGLLISGSGLSLLFSVDGTVRNWLREPFRATRLQAYRSGFAARAFRLAEIWSVAHLVAPAPNQSFDPLAELDASHSDGVIPSTSLLNIMAKSEEALEEYRAQD